MLQFRLRRTLCHHRQVAMVAGAVLLVGFTDALIFVEGNWGPCADCKFMWKHPPDLNDSCSVGVAILLAVEQRPIQTNGAIL